MKNKDHHNQVVWEFPKGKSRGISGISALFSKTQSLIRNRIPKIPLGFQWEMMCFSQISNTVDYMMIEINNQNKQQLYKGKANPNHCLIQR